MIRVLLADDHTLFRSGVRRVLHAEADLEVVGETGRGQEILGLVKDSRPDVVLLDVSMPGRGGLETLEELKDRHGDVKVLMLTVHPENHFAIRCLKGGADGYMTKDAEPEELVRAIRKVVGGHKYITPQLAEQLALTVGQSFQEAPHERLSDREFEVMRGIGSGRTVSEIAEDLHLSVKTISTYRTRIIEKMNLRNNFEIMEYAIREGLVE
ncbi:MAG: response regulator [bacterium]